MIYRLQPKLGFTLIELMIAITIIGLIVGFGLSAYGKARERQVGVSAGEKLVSILQGNQGDARVGKKDCLGKYAGQFIEIVTPNIVRSYSTCENDDGDITENIIPGITFAQETTFLFYPLDKGIEIKDGSSQYLLDYESSANLTYEIRLTSSGTIEYLGVQ